MTRQAKVALIVISIAVAIGLIAAFIWPLIYSEFIAAPADAAHVPTATMMLADHAAETRT